MTSIAQAMNDTTIRRDKTILHTGCFTGSNRGQSFLAANHIESVGDMGSSYTAMQLCCIKSAKNAWEEGSSSGVCCQLPDKSLRNARRLHNKFPGTSPCMLFYTLVTASHLILAYLLYSSKQYGKESTIVNARHEIHAAQNPTVCPPHLLLVLSLAGTAG